MTLRKNAFFRMTLIKWILLIMTHDLTIFDKMTLRGTTFCQMTLRRMKFLHRIEWNDIEQRTLSRMTLSRSIFRKIHLAEEHSMK